MSEEEQHAIAGKTMAEYVQVRRELASVNSKANEYSQILKRISELLGPSDPNSHQLRDFSERRWAEAVEKFSAKDDLVNLAKEITELTNRKGDLRHSLREIGFEPKD